MRALLAIVLLVLLAGLAQADTQVKFVGVGASNGTGTEPWINLGNISADDGSSVDMDGKMRTPNTTEDLEATMTGNVFTIPAGATIDGILVKTESVDGESGGCVDSVIKIMKAGTQTGDDQSRGGSSPNEWPVAETANTWGGATALWGATPWTVAEVNAGGFGVGIKLVADSSTWCLVSIDYVQITVYYTPGEPVAGEGLLVIN